jgi:hypothetical protein
MLGVLGIMAVPRMCLPCWESVEAGALDTSRMASAVPMIVALPAQDSEVGGAEGEGGVIEVWLDVVDDGGVFGDVDPFVTCRASAARTLDGGSTCRLPGW